jgi:predicted RNA binding protein YcfA (HicA-like mRNA interferase family)
MSQLEKLYRRFLDGQQLDFNEFERLLRSFGYQQQRQAGSHRAWVTRPSETRVSSPRGANTPTSISFVSLDVLWSNMG